MTLNKSEKMLPRCGLRFVAVLALLCALQAASAATYYVAMTGNNTDSGTAALPWRTIQNAADIVQPGDTVVVQAGNYGELVNLWRDALPGQPITFQGDGAETAGFNCRKSDYVIRGFRVNGTNATVLPAIAIVYVYANAHRIHVLDNYFHDAKNKFAIWFDRGSNAIPANSSSFNVVSNNSFVAIDYININCFGVSNKFLRNVFRDSNGQADTFRFFGEGHIAADNLVTNISNVVENHTDFFQVFGPVSPPSAKDYNYVRNIILERNIVVDSKLQICMLETFDNPRGYMTNLIFRNNLFINLPYAANVDMDGTKWYNNLFCRVNYANGGHCFAFGGPKGSAYGTEIKNNIFYECGNGQDWVGWYPTVGLLGIYNFDLKADYNFVCGPGFAPKKAFLLDPNGWGAQGQEVHGINGGNPGFVSIGNLNFRLSDGSLLIDTGVPIPTFSNDADQIARGVGGYWDVGPYEFSGQSTLRPSPPRNPRVVITVPQ
jgi:hypothetical protein